MTEIEGRFERRTPGVGQPKTVLDRHWCWEGMTRTNRVGVEQRANAVRLLLRERFAGVNPDVFASGPANRDYNMKRYDCTHEKCIDESTSIGYSSCRDNSAADRSGRYRIQGKSDDGSALALEYGGTRNRSKESYSGIYGRSNARIRQNSSKSLQSEQLEQSFRIEVVSA